MTNVLQKFNIIENKTFVLQKVFKGCEISLIQALSDNSNRKFTTKFIEYLIINLEQISHEKTETIKYSVKFDWVLTTEEIITYSLLTIYDLKIINIQCFLLQFEKELENYSSLNAINRLNFLLERRKIC